MTLALSSVGKAGRRTHSAPQRASLMTIYTVWKERRALANLDPARLQDLGITQFDAAQEAARPVWDVPKDRC